MVNLPDLVKELVELKKETKLRLNNEYNNEEYLKKIIEIILDMSFLCPCVLMKIVHYMADHYFSYYIPRYIEDLSSYSYIVEGIRSIKYRIQLFIFFKFVKELLQEVNDENHVLNYILSATDLCLLESKTLASPSSSPEFSVSATSATTPRLQNNIFWEQALNKYIETIIPLFTELKQNHSQEYDKINKFFEIECKY